MVREAEEVMHSCNTLSAEAQLCNSVIHYIFFRWYIFWLIQHVFKLGMSRSDHVLSDSIGIGCYISIREICIFILIIFYQIYFKTNGINVCVQHTGLVLINIMTGLWFMSSCHSASPLMSLIAINFWQKKDIILVGLISNGEFKSHTVKALHTKLPWNRLLLSLLLFV